MAILQFGTGALTGHSSSVFWESAVRWAASQDHFMIFDNNGIDYPNGPFPKMIMAGCRRIMTFENGHAFQALKYDRKNNGGWLCGFLGYDLKNEVEDLHSNHQDFTEFPEMYFFEPEIILQFIGDELIFSGTENTDLLVEDILNTPVDNDTGYPQGKLVKAPERDRYISNVKSIQNHILDGDMYEMNYCFDFGMDDVEINPLGLYQKLNNRSPAPFSVFGRFREAYLLSTSPERFLRKQGNVLLSQPIKGTIRRGKDETEDDMLRHALLHSEKERAENMMIVDLVRNDLTRSAVTGTINVTELFGIYTFRQLHQMISTVTAQLDPETDPVDAIRMAFPMGSMTGAPKIKVMELIEQYESGKRSIYSGAAGFFTPENDFDFNVVIRSIAYNRLLKKLGFWVGSAITFDSEAEKEYEECLLKAKAIMEVLEETGILKDGLLTEKD